MSELPLEVIPIDVRRAAWRDPESAWQALRQSILLGVRSPQTRRSYEAGLNSFIGWLRREDWPDFHRMTVQRYRAWLEDSGLSPSSINVYLSAIRKLAAQATANGFVDCEVASGIIRITGIRQKSISVKTCLTQEQASTLLALPDPSTLKGLRDRAILGLLLGCALRRTELARLCLDHFVLRDGHWVLMDLVGSGTRVRTVPVPAWAKSLVDDWTTAAGLAEGSVFRAVNKGGRVRGEHITDDVVWSITREYGARIGKPGLSPQDLRRTCARLCRVSGAGLEQIQLLLDHLSVQTTQRFLGTGQNVLAYVNDYLPIEAPATAPGRADQSRPLVKRKPVRSEPRTIHPPAAAGDRTLLGGGAEGT